MNIRLVIDFYTRNALFDSNQTYEENLPILNGSINLMKSPLRF